jgi:hypothetical protein
MKNDKHIDKGNSPFLDGLEKRNCFKVPQGYFARLHQAIGLRVQIGDKPFESVLQELKQQQNFALPANYFDGLAQRITAQTQPVELPKHSGFATPQGYFDVLYTAIQNRVSVAQTPAYRWQTVGVLRPALAFAAVLAIGAIVAWPLLTNNNNAGMGLTASNLPEFKTENYVLDNNKTSFVSVVDGEEKTGDVVAIKPKKNAVAGGLLQTASAADIEEYHDDYAAESLLDALPVADNTEDSHLFEIMAEEDIDLADLMESLN